MSSSLLPVLSFWINYTVCRLLKTVSSGSWYNLSHIWYETKDLIYRSNVCAMRYRYTLVGIVRNYMKPRGDEALLLDYRLVCDARRWRRRRRRRAVGWRPPRTSSSSPSARKRRAMRRLSQRWDVSWDFLSFLRFFTALRGTVSWDFG